MRKILIIGAGKSTSSLVRYLNEKSTTHNVQITIADKNLEQAQKIAKG